MIISTSNVAPLATVTELPESATQDINVITDGDYSSVYTATLSGELTITFTFATPQDINYIALGGTNISRKDRVTIKSTNPVELRDSLGNQLFDSLGNQLFAQAEGTIDDSTLGLSESRVMVYKTDLERTTEVEVKIFGQGEIVIAEIAMGLAYEVPRGEQSGYNRAWAVPNVKARSATGLDGAPVNFVYEASTQVCTLTVPNNLMSDYDAGWYNMLKFTSRNTFYVLEDDNKFHSYAGFATSAMSTKAHPQTRLLGASQFTFNAFSNTVL
jgi:hypothetical protein